MNFINKNAQVQIKKDNDTDNDDAKEEAKLNKHKKSIKDNWRLLFRMKTNFNAMCVSSYVAWNWTIYTS